MPRLTQSHPMGPFCTGGRRGRSQQRDRVSAKRLDLGKSPADQAHGGRSSTDCGGMERRKGIRGPINTLIGLTK
jgi:hypothetical protein